MTTSQILKLNDKRYRIKRDSAGVRVAMWRADKDKWQATTQEMREAVLTLSKGLTLFKNPHASKRSPIYPLPPLKDSRT